MQFNIHITMLREYYVLHQIDASSKTNRTCKNPTLCWDVAEVVLNHFMRKDYALRWFLLFSEWMIDMKILVNNRSTFFTFDMYFTIYTNIIHISVRTIQLMSSFIFAPHKNGSGITSHNLNEDFVLFSQCFTHTFMVISVSA